MIAPLQDNITFCMLQNNTAINQYAEVSNNKEFLTVRQVGYHHLLAQVHNGGGGKGGRTKPQNTEIPAQMREGGGCTVRGRGEVGEVQSAAKWRNNGFFSLQLLRKSSLLQILTFK